LLAQQQLEASVAASSSWVSQQQLGALAAASGPSSYGASAEASVINNSS